MEDGEGGEEGGEGGEEGGEEGEDGGGVLAALVTLLSAVAVGLAFRPGAWVRSMAQGGRGHGASHNPALPGAWGSAWRKVDSR